MVSSRLVYLTPVCLLKRHALSPRANTFRNGHRFEKVDCAQMCHAPSSLRSVCPNGPMGWQAQTRPVPPRSAPRPPTFRKPVLAADPRKRDRTASWDSPRANTFQNGHRLKKANPKPPRDLKELVNLNVVWIPWPTGTELERT